MAAKTKAKPKAKQTATRKPTPPRGAPRYTQDMRLALVAAIKAADKAGTPRRSVYDKFAADWTKQLGSEVTHKNVASCFQNYKGASAGPKAAPKPKAKTKPKAVAKPKVKRRRKVTAAPKAAPAPEPTPVAHTENGVSAVNAIAALDGEIITLRVQLADMAKSHATAVKRAEAAERRLERIRKAVG